jgi:hypothetical protein
VKRLFRFVLAAAVFTCGCSTDVPEVDFCDVLKSARSFEDREFSTELAVIPNEHGWTAHSFKCNQYFMVVGYSPFIDPAEKHALAQKVYQLTDVASPLNAVRVRVKARIEYLPTSRRFLVLKLLSARQPTIIDIPEEYFELPEDLDLSKPPPKTW